MVIMYAQSSTLRKNAFDALKRVSFMVFRRCKSYHPRTSFCAAFVDVGGGGLALTYLVISTFYHEV